MKVFGVNINLSHTFWLTAVVFARAGMSLVGSILIARIAGAEFYGKYLYVLSLAGIGALIMIPGYNNGLINSAANNTYGDFKIAEKEKLKFYPYYLLFFCLIAVLMYAVGKGFDIAFGFIIFGIFAGLLQAFNGYDSYYVGSKKYVEYFKWSMLGSFATIIPSITYFAAQLIFTATIPVSVIVSVTVLWQLSCQLVQRAIVKKQLNNSITSTGLKKYAANLSYMSIVGSLQSYIDQFIVGSLINYSALAYYSLAKRILDALIDLCGSMQKYLQPRLLNKSREMARIYFKTYLKGYLALIPALGIIYAVLPYFFTSFYGQEFCISAYYARLLLIIPVVDFPNIYVEAYLRAIQSYKDMWMARIIGVIMLLTMVPLVALFHIEGLIICKIATYAITSVAMIYILYKGSFKHRYTKPVNLKMP
ncbi:MAG: hypothetical protein PHW69_03635 [Elusimicrobiaceae bacterium]|nr:hypothetical protein [Elusimicrobiaceae bacterium]